MNLSRNFTLSELIKSDTAIRKGINNNPNAEQIEKLKDLGVKNVVIIAGSHIDIDLTKSWEYIIQIEKLFKNNGFNVFTYTGNHPDDDLILSSRVKYFIEHF